MLSIASAITFWKYSFMLASVRLKNNRKEVINIMNTKNLKFLRRNQVQEKTGLSRSTIYYFIKEGTFPKPVSLGARAVAWVEHEVDAWLLACIKKRNDQYAL